MGRLKDKYIEKMQEEYTIADNGENLIGEDAINYEEKQFNKETALGVAVQALVKKYPNNQELGDAIRSLVNSFE